MTDFYPYKFNVETVDYAKVVAYLGQLPSHRYRIAQREMVGTLTIQEWRSVKEAAAEADARLSGDDHQVTDDNERAALIATDSDEKIPITLLGLPTVATRRLLNRVAIQAGVNASGITREDWCVALTRGANSYLIQFANKDDALLFKLAMWKRPDGEVDA